MGLEKIHSIKRLLTISKAFNLNIAWKENDIDFIDSIYRGRYPAEEGNISLKAGRPLFFHEVAADGFRHLQPVIQVFPKTALFNIGKKISIRRGDNSDIDLPILFLLRIAD